MGESRIHALRVDFNSSLRLEFHGSTITSFLFCNRYRRIVKGILWDRNGFWLLQKKLERDRFPWPQTEEAARKISAEQLKMLLDGIDFWNAHQALDLKSVS